MITLYLGIPTCPIKTTFNITQPPVLKQFLYRHYIRYFTWQAKILYHFKTNVGAIAAFCG